MLWGIVSPPAPLTAENRIVTGDASAEEVRNLLNEAPGFRGRRCWRRGARQRQSNPKTPSNRSAIGMPSKGKIFGD